MYVDAEGNIGNAPAIPEFLGNIRQDRLLEIVQKEAFQTYWNITKDQCEVCKDCEHRYSCIDSRGPVKQIKESTYYFKEACNYDPYTNEWDFTQPKINEEKAMKMPKTIWLEQVILKTTQLCLIKQSFSA